MCWQEVIGSFKFRAKTLSICVVYFILFVWCLMLTRISWFSWQGMVIATSKTWVRVPGLHYLNNIFPYAFTCSFSVKVHHTSSRSKCTRVQEIQIKGAGLKNTINVSQRCYTPVEKSNEAKVKWAWIAKLHLLSGAWYPFGLQLLLIFSFYSCYNFLFFF